MDWADNIISVRIREARGNDSAATHQRHGKQRPVLDISGHADIGNAPTKGAIVNDTEQRQPPQPTTEATIAPSVDGGGMYSRLAAILKAEQQAVIDHLAAAQDAPTPTTIH